MEVGTYKFHRRALMAFHALTDDEQAQVLEALAPLVDTPVPQWAALQVKKLTGDQSLYLVRVNHSLRAIVRAADGQEPEVMDLVPQETLDLFAKAAAKNGD
jgi:hypothetical protein